MALISPKHASRLVWGTLSDKGKGPENNDRNNGKSEWNEEDDGYNPAEIKRMYQFRVEQTSTEEEGVTIHPGFTVCIFISCLYKHKRTYF